MHVDIVILHVDTIDLRIDIIYLAYREQIYAIINFKGQILHIYEKNLNTAINSTSVILNHQEFDNMLLSYTNTHT